MLLAVYGTLRKGEALSLYLDKYREKGTTELVTLRGLKMFVLGAFPGVKVTNDPKDKIVAELIDFKINSESANKLLDLLDAVEGVDSGLFYRHLFDTYKGPAVIYVTKVNTEGAPVIMDWVKDWSSKNYVDKSTGHCVWR